MIWFIKPHSDSIQRTARTCGANQQINSCRTRQWTEITKLLHKCSNKMTEGISSNFRSTVAEFGKVCSTVGQDGHTTFDFGPRWPSLSRICRRRPGREIDSKMRSDILFEQFTGNLVACVRRPVWRACFLLFCSRQPPRAFRVIFSVTCICLTGVDIGGSWCAFRRHELGQGASATLRPFSAGDSPHGRRLRVPPRAPAHRTWSSSSRCPTLSSWKRHAGSSGRRAADVPPRASIAGVVHVYVYCMQIRCWCWIRRVPLSARVSTCL